MKIETAVKNLRSTSSAIVFATNDYPRLKEMRVAAEMVVKYLDEGEIQDAAHYAALLYGNMRNEETEAKEERFRRPWPAVAWRAEAAKIKRYIGVLEQ